LTSDRYPREIEKIDLKYSSKVNWETDKIKIFTVRSIEERANIDLLIELAKRMENAYYELEDCANEIEDISKGIDVTESDLDKIAGRMNTLKRIKEKYKRTLSELIAYREYLKEKENGTLKTYSHKEVWGE